MTTPEHFRRRQRIGNGLVAVTILLACLSVWHNERQNDRQDECQARAFSELSEVLTVRGELTERERDAVAGVLIAADEDRSFGSPSLEEALAEFVTTRRWVKEQLAGAKIPPFPTGKCD